MGGRPYELVSIETATSCAPDVADIDVAFISRDVTGLSTKHEPADSLRACYAVLRRSVTLKWIHIHSAGADRPIYVELRARGVTVTTSSGANADVVAQSALAGLLALSRHFPQLMAAQRAHAWAPLLGLSVTSRYRASGLTERQQLKWFILATALTLGGLIALGMEAYITGGRSSETGVVLFGLTGMTIPIAIGIAILRYRLYEIDRLVSRTLAYAVLSAVLVGVYVAGFVGIQAGLASFTTSGGPIAVAASTLVVFALFQPLRRRLQRAMDRRFNRSRYDAQRTIDTFAARLRDEVDSDRLSAELRTVVRTSLAPASVAVWLRHAAPGFRR